MSFVIWKDGKGFNNLNQQITGASIYYVDIPKKTSDLINDVPFLVATDVLQANSGFVITGGEVTWVENYQYLTKPVKIFVGGNTYGPSLERTVTLDNGGAQDRKDRVVATYDLDTGSCYTRVIKGTEGAGVAPPFNRSTEVSLAIIDVASGTTEPAGLTTLLVYNENDANDFTPASSIVGGGSISFNNTDNPLRDSNCVSVTNFKTGDEFSFSDSVFNPLNYSLLEFYIRNESGTFFENYGAIEVVLVNGSDEVSDPVIIDSYNNGTNPYYFNSDQNTWQNVTIPIHVFNISTDQATKVVFRKTDEMEINGDSFKIDLVRFQSGIPIVQGVNKTHLSQFINDLDIASPLTTDGDIYIYNSGNAKLGIGSAGQVLTVVGGLPVWQNPVTGVTDHTLLSNIGTNTHAQIDTHIADASIHYTMASISITESQISDLGPYNNYVHPTTPGNIHIPAGGLSGQVLEWSADGVAVWANPVTGVTDHTLLSNIGTNTHAQIDTHIADASLHYTMASISITESQISDLGPYNNYVHPTGDGNLHIPANGTTNAGKVLTSSGVAGVYTWENPVTGVTDHTLLSNIGTNTHAQIDTHIADSTVHVPSVGINGQVLTVSGGVATWSNPVTGVTDHTLLSNIGTNTHAQIDTHIADTSIHFTMASISITESQISDLGPYNNYVHPTSSGISSNNSGRTYIQDIIIDANGHITDIRTATETVVNTDTNQLTTFYMQDGDGTNVLMSHGKYFKFKEGTGDGASIDINFTDTTPGSVSDPFDLEFAVTNTDKGSNQNIFKNFAVSGQSTVTASLNNDTVTLVAGSNMTITTLGKTITFASTGSGGIALTDLSATSPILYNNGTGVFSHANTAGNKHIPTGGSTDQVLKYSASGTASWATLPSVNTVAFTGASIIVEPKSDQSSTNASHYMTFVDTLTDGYHRLKKDAGVTYNPSTNAMTVSGSITANDFIGSSDRNLKENIEDYCGCYINSKYVKFNFKGSEHARIGVIAQDLKEVHPEFVRQKDNGELAVSYQDLHSAEIAGLKKREAKLKARVERLEKIIEKLI